MELHNLPATSKDLEAEVLAQYRRCTSDQIVERWLSEELTQLAHTPLETSSSFQQEAWLKRLFASLRLHHLAQVGETAIMAQSHAAPCSGQAGQIEVLDILTEQGDWARLCVLGTGTYEMLLHRLRAMAMMGTMLTASSAEYVTRFCTEHERFCEPQAALNMERNWVPLLLSLRQALMASPLIEKLKKVEAPIARQSERRARTSAKHIQYPAVFSSWRERIVTFGCGFGLVFICVAIVFVSPAWVLVQIKHRTKVAPVRETSAAPVLLASPAPVTKAVPTPIPTTEMAATPVAAPTPEVAVTPVATPTPVIAPTERAGFYVIGLATREEANAQAEAQQHRQKGLQPRVIYSSNWSGLTPNYYQVVYGIFARRGDTAALRKDLEQRGIKTYVMHSGQRVRP